MRFDFLFVPLEARCAQRFKHKFFTAKPARAGAYYDVTGPGHRLQTGRKVWRFSCNCPGFRASGTDQIANNNVAGCDAHPPQQAAPIEMNTG